MIQEQLPWGITVQIQTFALQTFHCPNQKAGCTRWWLDQMILKVFSNLNDSISQSADI